MSDTDLLTPPPPPDTPSPSTKESSVEPVVIDLERKNSAKPSSDQKHRNNKLTVSSAGPGFDSSSVIQASKNNDISNLAMDPILLDLQRASKEAMKRKLPSPGIAHAEKKLRKESTPAAIVTPEKTMHEKASAAKPVTIDHLPPKSKTSRALEVPKTDAPAKNAHKEDVKKKKSAEDIKAQKRPPTDGKPSSPASQKAPKSPKEGAFDARLISLTQLNKFSRYEKRKARISREASCEAGAD